MLTRINIKGFRGFEQYELAGLTQVNLLVGKNNCGKTAMLECIHFLASGGDPSVLIEAAQRRGEWGSAGREERPSLNFSHFFFGHEVNPGDHFEMNSDNGLPNITVTASPWILEESKNTESLFDDEDSLHSMLRLKIERDGISPSPHRSDIFLSDDGIMRRRRPIGKYWDERPEGPPIIFISPDSLESASLGKMWRQILLDKQETEVLGAMQILEKNIEDIVFEPGGYGYRYRERSGGILVSFQNNARRIPLGSMGDGMRRLLALAISLIHAKNGFLIIDEIDTGFHYSIMAKMWELVVKIATESNIQVIATTHSSDCIRGLGMLCKQKPEIQDRVAAHKIERNLERNVAFTGEDILNAVEQDIEIR